MDLIVFSPNEVISVARALRSVVSAPGGAMTDHEVELIEAVSRMHGVEVDARALAPITPEEVAKAIPNPHQRKRLVQLAIVMALVEGVPGPDTDHSVRTLARALDVGDGGVQTLHDVVGKHSILARIDMMRRIRGFMKRSELGVPRIFQIAISTALGIRDEELAAKYHALGECAPGTLGRALHDHWSEHHFAFPGEPGGFPEMVFHDVGHVLSGYGVDPQGEIQQAAFQAGFVKTDGFTFLLFGILQFHVGMRITPVAKGEHGYFDVKRVMRAAERGAAMNIDLSDRFDIFAYANESLDSLRARWNVAPL